MKPKVYQDMIQALIGNLLFVCLLTYKWKDLCYIESFIRSKSMEFGNCWALCESATSGPGTVMFGGVSSKYIRMMKYT